MKNNEELKSLSDRILKGGAPKYHEKNKEVGKYFARERIEKLDQATQKLAQGGGGRIFLL